MRVGFYQFDSTFGHIEENRDHVVKALDRAYADLVVLPELCISGYQFISTDEVATFAEDAATGPTCTRIAEVCKKRGIFAVAGIAEAAGEQFFNTAILVGPSGLIGRYRKLHLFRDEKLWFSPGDLPLQVFRAGDARVGMMICFDWIFPETARTLALAGADIICHPANLVLPYCQDAMKVRCLENGVYSVTANRVGFEHRGEGGPLRFTGGSQIVTPEGKVLCNAGKEEVALITYKLDPRVARNKKLTPENHLFRDRRPDLYKL